MKDSASPQFSHQSFIMDWKGLRGQRDLLEMQGLKMGGALLFVFITFSPEAFCFCGTEPRALCTFGKHSIEAYWYPSPHPF